MGSNDSKEDDCTDPSGRENLADKRKDQTSRPLKSKVIDPRIVRPDDPKGTQDQANEDSQGRHQLPI